MTMLQNANAIESGGYNVTNSLRFRSSASAYLSRTPASAGTQTTWTWSGWIKRSIFGSQQKILTAGSTGSLFASFEFIAGDNFQFFAFNGSTNAYLVTTQVFRDPSAWYHIVFAVDTTQATASNRIKIYVNGTQVTAFSTSTYPSQNFTFPINNNVIHNIGRDNINAGDYFDGYLADVNFIDGSAKTPSDFGETDTTTGVWKPKAYTGTYGTNGFYLKFSDIATTSGSNAGLGKDFSGNTNYWTTNNISVTAGTTYDAMKDSPTNTSATVANYAVANPLDKSTNVTVTNGNLTVSTAVTNAGIRGSMYVSSGKYYWEATCTTKTSYPNLGIADASWGLTNVGSTSGSYGYATDGLKYNNGSTASYGATYTSGDVIGVALDLDAGTLVFYKNNTSQGTAYSSLSGTFAPAFAGQGSDVWNVNFGQRPFAYTPPTGFVALNTFNLPTSTIVKGNTVMDATLYTGNGYPTSGTQSITNAASFKPDLVWIKIRSGAGSHTLTDSVRGVNSQLFSNQTAAQETNTDHVTAFNSNGFSLGTGSSGTYPSTNSNGSTYVGWQWQAGQGSTSSNTSGSITSTVSVNTTAGFSIVSYTGTGANATVGHGLGVAPRMIICKNRASATDWAVYHASVGNTGALRLNLTAVTETDSRYWNNTTPTSTVFSIGSSSTVNGSSNLQVAYCFAEIAGFSRFGNYTGGGNTGASTPNANGPFIYLGFRPKFVLIKRTSSAADWVIYDSVRGPSNANYPWLYPNSSSAEVATETVDFLSNGFKIRSESGATMFPDGATFIYAAFAESPFSSNNRAR